MTDLLVAGELIVDFHPESRGPLADVAEFTRRPGGAPANVAVGLARLDCPPAFWTRVGADPFGEFLAGVMAENGVPLDRLERDPAAKTGLAFVSLGEDADREFSLYLEGAASTRLRVENLPDVSAVEWVHVGGVELAFDPAREAVLELIDRANDAGATVSFDPNARRELWDEYDYAETLDAVLPRVDVVKASAEDLAPAGIEGPPDELAAAVCERGPHTALVTLGDDGAYAQASAEAPWGEATATHPGYPVDPVDTTGAGDAFTAGVIASLSSGDSLAGALELANAVAALTTTAQGAMTALPTREEVRAFTESESRAGCRETGN